VAIHGRVALSHLPEDEVINIGLVVSSRERVPTRAMAQDRFYENYNPAVSVSLTRRQVTNSDVTSIATTITKALNEQLDPAPTTRKIKTLKVNRQKVVNNCVHACLYFMQPTGHS